LARELIILPRFKRDYRTARKHLEFEVETVEYVFDLIIFGGKLPEAFREHRQFDVTFTAICVWQDRKVVEQREYFDMELMLRQLRGESEQAITKKGD
jgi:hypothetical protein